MSFRAFSKASSIESLVRLLHSLDAERISGVFAKRFKISKLDVVEVGDKISYPVKVGDSGSHANAESA